MSPDTEADIAHLKMRLQNETDPQSIYHLEKQIELLEDSDIIYRTIRAPK